MRCEDVQLELARDAITLALREAVAAHVQVCPTCRGVQLVYGRIGNALRNASMWEPPQGFARMVAMRASQAVPSDVSMKDPFIFQSVLDATSLSVLVGMAAYMGARFLDPLAPLLATLTAPTQTAIWMWVGFSYSVAAFLAHRARA